MMLSLSRCLGALGLQGVDLAPEEFCDALWLAARGFIPGEARIVAPSREPQTAKQASASQVSAAARSSHLGEEKTTDPHQESKSGQPVHALGDSGRMMGGSLVSLPSAPAITRGIEFDRALRPLRQRRQLRRTMEFDEEATVAAIAETGVWHTVMRPARGRWLDLTLVVEESPTMRLWQETAIEFRRLLGRACAPRSLRTFQLEWSPKRMLMHTSGGRPVSLQAPCQNSGSNPILVLSDAMSFGWLTADIPELLAQWASRQTTSIVQMLPPAMWKRSALRQVKFGAVEGSRGNGGEWPPVTITTLDPSYLQRYSRMLSGGGGEGVAAYRSSRRQFSVVSSHALERRPAFDPRALSDEDVERIYQRFEQFSSPEARKLARYLASAPLILPVMRLVQRVLVADAAPAQLAEILLSGILYRRQTEAAQTVSANEIEYEFIRGVRERLLDLGGLELSFQTIRLLSSYFEERLGKGGAFTALLADPTAAAKTFKVAAGGPGDQPFARVAGMLLERMGFTQTAAAPSQTERNEQPTPEPNVAAVSRVNEEPKPPSKPTEKASIKADISRIVKYAPAEFIGREAEIKLLNDAWAQARKAESRRPQVITFVAFGGEGKTSLVSKWAADLAFQNWPGCDAAFAWSFYSQGTREQAAVSSDVFLAAALTFFGDAKMAGSAASAFDKGQRLARLIGECRALLILDGLEPLQYAPTSPSGGDLRDVGVSVLLKALAASNRGLCVVTSRYAISDLRAYWQTTAPMHELLPLSTAAGVVLLRTIGVHGSDAEVGRLVEDLEGHALALQITGQFLVRAFAGDIRRSHQINLGKADARIHGGHAFRVIEAYLRWMDDDSEEARRELAVLKLLGLFDRPATADHIDALRRAPAIAHLTEPLVGLDDTDWEFSLASLSDAKLLTVNRDRTGVLFSLNARWLVREYFNLQLREQQPEAWRAAHQRLYENVRDNTRNLEQPDLEDLLPLGDAVEFGCQAGLHQQAFDEIYYERIQRGREGYAWRKLGAFGFSLGVIGCFFEQRWSRVTPALSESAQALVLSDAAYCLGALGRFAEALEPMRVGFETSVRRGDLKSSAIDARNLSELELTVGEVAEAVRDAEQSVTYSDRAGDVFQQVSGRAAHADALFQVGRRSEAGARFQEAEQLLSKIQPAFPLLNSFRFCELLLTKPERVAWQLLLEFEIQDSELRTAGAPCDDVSERTKQLAKLPSDRNPPLLSNAFNHLNLGRAGLYTLILQNAAMGLNPNVLSAQLPVPVRYGLRTVQAEIDKAVVSFRRAGVQHEIPHSLLTRAWLRFLTGARTGPESAQEDLDEAWEIAERGPMKLHIADIHLYRARLFGGMKDEGGGMKYPWNKNPDGSERGPKDDLAAAEKLINECGYHRRDEELADAREAAKNW